MANPVKAVVTATTSLLPEIEEALNKQIVMEGESSTYYLAAASWCEKEGYENAANYLYKHAEEERSHMLKIFHYVNEAGGHAIAPTISGIRHNYDNLRHVFESGLEHEISVTRSINDLVDLCFKVRDFATFQFLQWFVMEQREEEVHARRIVEIFDIIGEEGQGLWLIDQEIGKLDDAAHAGVAAPEVE